MEEFPPNEPILETVPNDGDSVSDNDLRMSEMLGGLNIRTSIGKNNPPAGEGAGDEGGDEGGEGGEPAANEPPTPPNGTEPPPNEPTPPNKEDGEGDDEPDFWGKPGEDGSYKLSPEKLAYLKNTLAMAAQNAAARENMVRQKLNEYEARIEAMRRAQQPQPTPPQPVKKTALDIAKDKMVADLTPSMGKEAAEQYAENQIALFKAATAEQSEEGLKQLSPLLGRFQENVYREDVVNIAKTWGNKIASNLRDFNVSPAECHRNVVDYVNGYISSFQRNHGRRPTQQEIYQQLAVDSGTLGSMTLSERLRGIINKRRQAQAQEQAQGTEQPAPPKTAPAPPATPKPQDTVSSVAAAQKRVTTGENLRAANDAGIMGTTPSSGTVPPNNDRERMARMLSEANGGNFTFNS